MDGLGKLVLPFGNNSKAKQKVDEATRVLADAQRLRHEAATQARVVQQETRKIVDLLVFATRVDVTTPAQDYPTPYLLVDAKEAREAIAAWKEEAER